MPSSFLKRLDIAYPQLPNPRGIYGVKFFKNEDLDDLETAVNIYLLALPASTDRWHPHLASLQYDNYIEPQGNTLTHVCTITIFAVGVIESPPTA